MAITKYRAGHLCTGSVPAIAMEELTLAEVHEAMLAGRLTCSQLLQGYLQVGLCWHARLGLSAPAVSCSKGHDLPPCMQCTALLCNTALLVAGGKAGPMYAADKAHRAQSCHADTTKA